MNQLKAFADNMNASAYIYTLVAWLQSIGVTCDLHAFDLHYGGLYRSETQQIFINEPKAERALMTLAHEAGHHVGYVLAGERNDARTSLHHERQAYVYGWRTLRLIGADRLITRAQWIAECAADHRAWLEDQRSATPVLSKRFRGEIGLGAKT